MKTYVRAAALASTFCASTALAGEPISIAEQFAKPTEATRVSYGHWSFIRSNQQSHVCVTSNIDSETLPRLLFQGETQPRGAEDEAAITLTAGKWDTGQTYSVFLKLFMAQDPQNGAAAHYQRYRFKFGNNALLTFPDGLEFAFKNYDQRYSIAPPKLIEPLLDQMQTHPKARLSGTLVGADGTLTGRDETFQIELTFAGFETAYDHMRRDCQ